MNRPDRQINHPGRKLTLQCIDYICIAATPPSKGGETFTNLSCHKTTLRLTAITPDPLQRGNYESLAPLCRCAFL